MGIIVKNLTLAGITIAQAYLSLDKNTTWTNLTTFQATVNVFGSLEERTAGKKPLTTFKIGITEKQLNTTPVYKALYEKLKDMYPDFDEAKDLETAGEPVVISTENQDGTWIIKGKASQTGEVIHSTEGYKVNQKGKEFELALTEGAVSLMGAGSLYSEKPGCFRSSEVLLNLVATKEKTIKLKKD